MTNYSNHGDGVMNIGGSMGHVVAGRGNHQVTSSVVATGSLEGLAVELERLHLAVSAADPSHDDDAAAVQEAIQAAKSGDRRRARAALTRTSSWLLRMAETLGVQLVVGEIRGHLPD